jgi:hypothetical protein
VTDVTTGQDHDGPGLSAADEQLLRELTERARTGGLKLTGQGGLLGKLTKMVVQGAREWMFLSRRADLHAMLKTAGLLPRRPHLLK